MLDLRLPVEQAKPRQKFFGCGQIAAGIIMPYIGANILFAMGALAAPWTVMHGDLFAFVFGYLKQENWAETSLFISLWTGGAFIGVPASVLYFVFYSIVVSRSRRLADGAVTAETAFTTAVGAVMRCGIHHRLCLCFRKVVAPTKAFCQLSRVITSLSFSSCKCHRPLCRRLSVRFCPFREQTLNT